MKKLISPLCLTRAHCSDALCVSQIKIIIIITCVTTQAPCDEDKKTRLPGAVPQPIGLFLFCIEFGWG